MALTLYFHILLIKKQKRFFQECKVKKKYCEIHIKNHINDNWSEWFGGLTVKNLENGEVLISGILPDDAALHGLLAKIRDLNLKLISVKVVDEK